MSEPAETDRERKLRAALEGMVVLFDVCERLVQPDEGLGGLELWTHLEQAAAKGREALVDDDLLMLRPGRERVRDVANFLVRWDEIKAAGHA